MIDAGDRVARLRKLAGLMLGASVRGSALYAERGLDVFLVRPPGARPGPPWFDGELRLRVLTHGWRLDAVDRVVAAALDPRDAVGAALGVLVGRTVSGLDLADWIEQRDDIEAVVHVHVRPPAPGELGGVTDAVEVATVLTPLAKVVLDWLTERAKDARVAVTARKADGTSLELEAADEDAARRLIADIQAFFTPDPDGRDAGAGIDDEA